MLILGDMFELGDESPAEHLAILQKALDTSVDERIFIGKDFTAAAESMGHGPWTIDHFYLTAEDAITGLKSQPIKNSTILIKGSRGMALERLVDLF